MVKFIELGDILILAYETMYDTDWVYEELEKTGSVIIKGTYEFRKSDLYDDDISELFKAEHTVYFKFAQLEEDYFKVNSDILGIDFNLFIHKSTSLTQKSFTSERNVPIFPRINDLKPDDIYLGGNAPNAIPDSEFSRLLKQFPNSYEIRKYVNARVSAVVRNYVESKIDGEDSYQKYLNKKLSSPRSSILESYAEGEILKYTALLSKLEKMLKSEGSYSETQWQDEIIHMLLLIYPKYISIFKEAPVRDSYACKNRSIDFLLVDSSGNTDIVEIKKPFDKCIVTAGRYRDNYIPLRELSGTVMQVEKYIFHLTKWGKKGEDKLTEKYKTDLPSNFKIRITNPSGIIIMGRDNNLSLEQKQDFEVIKRKYKNVIDILTYDDLISRLHFTIEQLTKTSQRVQQSAPPAP